MHVIVFLYVGLFVGGFQLLRAIYHILVSPLRDVPGPFLARFTKLWYLKNVHSADFEHTNIALHEKHGPIVRVAPKMYSIAHPDKAVYGIASKFPKGDWYEGMKHPSPDLWALFPDRNLKRHAETRKRFQHIYSMSSLITYESYVDKCTDIFSQRLDEFSSRAEAFDLGHWFICYAFDMIGEITYSRRFGFLDAGLDINGILAALRNNLSYGVLAGIFPQIHPYTYQLLQYRPNSGASGRNKLMAYVRGIIAEREQQRQDDKSKPVGPRDSGIDLEEGIPKDFLDKISDARDEHPDKVSAYHIFMMNMSNIIAGSDTTGISLSAIFYYLLKNPECLEKLRAEIDLAREEGRADLLHIKFSESQELPYLRAVIKESLRLHAAVGLPLWREVPEGGAEICGRYFPAGTTVGLNSWVGHYDPEVYGEDARQFRPERWIEAEKENSEKLKKMEAYYTPFGLGSRTCLGRHISILEMSKVVPELIRKFDFELEDPNRDWKTSNYWFVKPVDFRVKVRRRV